MCNMPDQTCQLLHSNYCPVIDASTTSTSCLLSCVEAKKDLSTIIVTGTFPRCNKNIHHVPILRQYIADVITVYASLYLDPEANTSRGEYSNAKSSFETRVMCRITEQWPRGRDVLITLGFTASMYRVR